MILKDLLDKIYDYQNIRLINAKTLKLIATCKVAADIKNNNPELLPISVTHIGVEHYGDIPLVRFVIYLNGDEYEEVKASKKGRKINAG